MKNLFILVTLGPILFSLCLAQERQPIFDVASIKPSKTNDAWFWNITPGGRLVARNASLKTLMMLAYRVQEFEIVGGPSWISNDQFDVEAKAEDGRNITNEQARQMLQKLLAVRFQLHVRTEARSRPIYALKVVRNGPPVSPDQTPPVSSAPPTDPGREMPRGALRMGRGIATGTAVPIPLLARFLGQALGRPVVDKTGLQARYDISLHWTPDDASPNSTVSSASPQDGPSLFTALQEQLGLKLEAGTGDVDVLVIESAEKPSVN
jgi:uncharacterized protein (TIGR03435 family)